MKKTFLSFCAATLVLLAAGCGNASRQKDAEGFPPAETLVADSVAIDQILAVDDMVLCGDYAMIYSPKTSKVLFRYRVPDWTLVDSSLVTGEGPDDLSQNSKLLPADRTSNVLWVSEPNRQKICRYDLSSTVRKTASVPGGRGDWIFRAQVCGDSLAVYEKFDFSTKAYWLRVARLADSLRVTDSLLCPIKSEVHTEGNSAWARLFNTPTVALSREGRLALWYDLMGTMMTYRVTAQGRLEPEDTFGQPLTQQLVDGTDFEALTKRDYSESIAEVSDSHIFMLRTRYDRVADDEYDSDNPRRIEELEIKVYDWQMNPVAKFRLDHPAARRVLIDSARGRIYAYDPDLDFEQVYVYDLML